jgi:N-acetylglucosaminyl-diphospho-decaprenol L-rhamnosyltransferase
MTSRESPAIPETPRAPAGQTSVDVLIVAYNSHRELGNCLESIRRHRPPADRIQCRVHVLDNASQDGTREMLRTGFPEVIVHASQTNQGFAAANNTLAALSEAEYILLLNPDTIWEQDVVSALVRALQADPGAVIAAPRLVYPDGRPQLSSQRLPSLRYELALVIKGTKLSKVPGFRDAAEMIERVRSVHAEVGEETRPSEFIWATCWLLPTHWVRQHGLFDPRFGLYDEDLDFCFRLRRTRARALYVASVELVHLGGASTTPRERLELVRAARSRYYRINHGWAAGFAYERIILPLERIRAQRIERRGAIG